MHINRTLTNNRGFTLVELSIVLVIVGLLIGGTVVGQSMISSAKINKVIGEFQQFQIAANLFTSRYKKYPGDYSQITTNCADAVSYCTYRGNNGSVDIIPSISNEGLYFFKQLQMVGFLKHTLGVKFLGTPNGTLVTGVGDTLHSDAYPELFWMANSDNESWNAGNAYHFPSHGQLFGKAADDVQKDSYLVLGTGSASTQDSGFTYDTLMAIDKKSDDGLRNSGKVRQGTYQTAASWAASEPYTEIGHNDGVNVLFTYNTLVIKLDPIY